MFQRFIAILLLLSSALAGRADGEWTEKTHDFGAFDEELGVVYCHFGLINTGSEPLAILSARANCGCTKPEYSNDPVNPGDTSGSGSDSTPRGVPASSGNRLP